MWVPPSALGALHTRQQLIDVLAFFWLSLQQFQHRFGNALPQAKTVNVAGGHGLAGTFSGHRGRVFPMLLEQEMGRAPNVNVR